VPLDGRETRPEAGEARPEAGAPHVVIVGGGGTGGALAHDLTLRGLRVTLVERGEVTSGTTGRHHGLLHSGARYATTDRAAAIECIAENKILRRICPGSFEENDGLFVAITDEDADYEKGFLESCWQCAVPTRRLEREEALRMEPGLNPELQFAIQVPDATMDAMRVPLRFFATARRNGADIRPFTEAIALTVAGRDRQRRQGARPRLRPRIRHRRGCRGQRRRTVGGQGGGSGRRFGVHRALAWRDGRGSAAATATWSSAGSILLATGTSSCLSGSARCSGRVRGSWKTPTI
jgi:hypothetical protein